jgi:hypothetical protein
MKSYRWNEFCKEVVQPGMGNSAGASAYNEEYHNKLHIKH